MDFIIPILSIVLIDLVLAGDNAVVIGMASRKLPDDQRMKAVILGTVGAVGLRILFTAIVTVLLQIPLLHAIGGILLLGIAYKLLTDEGETNISAGNTLAAAVRTIIIADAVMSLDNVLAVAGAAQGHIGLVVFGLMLSIPIVVWGSQLVARIMARYPAIVYLGAGILAWTGGSMFVEDEFLHRYFAFLSSMNLVLPILLVALVLGLGYVRNRRVAEPSTAEPSSE